MKIEKNLDEKYIISDDNGYRVLLSIDDLHNLVRYYYTESEAKLAEFNESDEFPKTPLDPSMYQGGGIMGKRK